MTKNKRERNTIFISIASYRDPELVKTIDDCLDKAKYPNNLRFGICWQHAEDEHDLEFKDKLDNEYNNNFRVIDIPYEKAKGVCFARSSIQSLYKGEKYHLMLDSHHRFEKNWDTTLIKMIKDLKAAGHKKPLLTAYIPSFDPDNDPAGRARVPWKMNFDRFIPEGAVFFLPADISDYKTRKLPPTCRFFSAHFCFVEGEWINEVPYDPNYYFHGEEITLAVRAYTHGYDLFHPHKVVVWHEYTRKGRTKAWDDDSIWVDRNTASHLRNRKLFGMDGEKQDIKFGKYGFGKERTLKDYEAYSGICFSNRGVQQYVIDAAKGSINYAPNPEKFKTKKAYRDSFLQIYKHCIDVGYENVPLKDYEFWVVAFKDEQDKDIFRKDADKQEIANMMKDPDGYCKIWREFNVDKPPHSWIVWPFSTSKGWCDPITGILNSAVVS